MTSRSDPVCPPREPWRNGPASFWGNHAARVKRMFRARYGIELTVYRYGRQDAPEGGMCHLLENGKAIQAGDPRLRPDGVTNG